MDPSLHTIDSFGPLRIRQHRKGYRFSLDALLLSGMVRLGAQDRVADLGSGSGIIALWLALRHPAGRFWAVEVQEQLAANAVFNTAINAMQDRIEVLCQDLRTLTTHQLNGPVDWVVANPPYRPRFSGRINPDNQRAIARHEIVLTLAELSRTAGRLLKHGGRFATIYPAERLAEMILCLRDAGLEPKALRPIYSFRDSTAKLVFIQACRGGPKGLVLEKPLIIYRRVGVYSAEVKNMLGF